MTAPFPSTGSFSGPNRPQRLECDLYDLECEGVLPSGLDGTFYRCGPDPQFPPRNPEDFFINGDGVVSMFRIADGHADFRMRYVRTEKFELERQARRALFGAYRNPYTDDPSVRGHDRTTANTNVLWHAGRLFALKEDGLPYELDPDTLETRGKWNCSGRLRSPVFTAHPKADPLTGELVFNGYEAKGDTSPDIACGVLDKAGGLAREDWFVPPYASMIHDFAVTQDHAVFPIMPTTSDLARLKAGGSHWAWDDSKPTFIGVMKRRGNADDIRYFRGPPRWSFHTMNAFEEGNLLHVDLTVSEINGFPYFPNVRETPWDPVRAQSYLTRWTCDLSGRDDGFTERRLWDKPVDFLRVDPRYLTRRYRHGFMCAKDLSRPVSPKVGAPGPVFNLLARIDHETASVESYYVGQEAAVQEPVFVPRSPGAEEGDGYLLAVVNRYDEGRAELIVLEALALARGPIARMRLPIQLRMAFHGEFVPAAALAGAKH